MVLRSWLRRRRAAPDLAAILADAGAIDDRGGVVLLVTALAPHLDRPVDVAHAILLAGGEADGDGRTARLVRALARLHVQLRWNRSDPRRWPEAVRRRVFDPDWMVRPCAGERVLAAAAHLVWREAADRLRGAGEDVALLAFAELSGDPIAAVHGRRRARCA